jgi:Ni/Fe-hydrogenase 1 B-type cytochrome subunit
MEEKVKVYAWEFPVRLTHWLNVLSVLTLAVTGFYIGKPFIHAISSKQYIMGWIRFIHFTAAYVYLMSFLIRVYWSFVGNKYASWRILFPFTKEEIGYIWNELRFYLFIRKEPPHTIGHTALSGVTYLVLILIVMYQIVSGFAMYSVNHTGMLWTVLGGWLIGVISLPTIRLFHHFFMYIILAFAILHIYISWFSDISGKAGMMGSIFNGHKFISKD